MGTNVWTPRWSAFLASEPTPQKARRRPLPLRVRTFSDLSPQSPENGAHIRHKTTSVADQTSSSPASHVKSASDSWSKRSRRSLGENVTPLPNIEDELTPPSSPSSAVSGEQNCSKTKITQVVPYDFSSIDYELERAKVLGQGLWSTVYLAEQKQIRTRTSNVGLPTPPITPEQHRLGSAPSLYAIKIAARQDAKEIFLQEARVLSWLQRKTGCDQYVIPFYGLDSRNGALVFEAVIGGSLENLISRLKQMTEVSRHLELISIFPGIANDLINGLEFLHSHGVIHADIKPGNVLLDILEHNSQSTHVIRARYIDFSAAFMPDQGDSDGNAGGTWDFMAPEQMRIRKDVDTSTLASDVWSLGITLLSILVGGSPYTAACGGNNFMLREAVKSGDPLGFARMDPVPRKRLAACQNFVDCCRLALKKDRDNRVTASGWVDWLEHQQLDQ